MLMDLLMLRLLMTNWKQRLNPWKSIMLDQLLILLMVTGLRLVFVCLITIFMDSFKIHHFLKILKLGFRNRISCFQKPSHAISRFSRIKSAGKRFKWILCKGGYGKFLKLKSLFSLINVMKLSVYCLL